MFCHPSFNTDCHRYSHTYTCPPYILPAPSYEGVSNYMGNE